jgi:hypothetical protein
VPKLLLLLIEFTVLFGFWAPSLQAKSSDSKEGLEGLEQIAGRFSSLDEFLKNKSALRQYEKVLMRYFGKNKFPCEGFSEVLGELRRWIAINPSIADRLWSVQSAWQREVKPNARFIRPKRFFHAIWEDLSRAGCTSKECTTPGMAAPGRWATALRESDFYYVQSGHKYSGLSVLVSKVFKGNKDFRLVSTSKQNVEALLDAWSHSLLAGDPLVYVDTSGDVRAISGHRSFGKVTGFEYRDKDAKELVAVLPDKCSNLQDAATTPKDLKGSLSPKAGSALAEVVAKLKLGNSANASAVSKNTQGLEVGLTNILKNSKSAAARAQAALGLDLLNSSRSNSNSNSNTNLTYPPNYSPSTRAVLVGALQDPSAAVRSQAALALADPGQGVPVHGQGHQGWTRGLGGFLNEAFQSSTNSGNASYSGSTALDPYLSPQAVKDRAFEDMIHDGVPLDPKSTDKMWEGNGNSPGATGNEADQIAQDYLRKGSSADAFRELQSKLRSRPELLDAVIASINRQLPEVCDECNKGIIATN